MDHPLRNEENKELRGRVVHLLKNGFSILRQSNIVFVCGGNERTHMRWRFERVFQKLLPDYEFFKPEFAMTNYFTMGDSEPFDIADFESLVGDLSLAIVLFPEAPGSFAELGYFSGQPDLASKVVLAMDANHQRSDSFISLGPATKIAKVSVFQPTIQLNYKRPDFRLVSTRIEDRAKLRERKRKFEPTNFADMSAFELFALVHKLVELLVIATGDDIESLLRGIFDSHLSPSEIKKIISILIGSGRLMEVGDFGHLAVRDGKAHALVLQDGFKSNLLELKVEISSILFAAETAFTSVLGELP
jgi:hypothetical protein